nr:MAG TPA: hypothetical protein [Caudoviricetes sp.]
MTMRHNTSVREHRGFFCIFQKYVLYLCCRF